MYKAKTILGVIEKVLMAIIQRISKLEDKTNFKEISIQLK